MDKRVCDRCGKDVRKGWIVACVPDGSAIEYKTPKAHLCEDCGDRLGFWMRAKTPDDQEAAIALFVAELTDHAGRMGAVVELLRELRSQRDTAVGRVCALQRESEKAWKRVDQLDAHVASLDWQLADKPAPGKRSRR